MLNLQYTRVTDAGLQQLGALTHLELLYLEDTQVTAAGADELRSRLPGATIVLQ